MVGSEAIARIAPVRDSITITVPPSAAFSSTARASSRSAMAWMKRSMVSCTSPPDSGVRVVARTNEIGRPSGSCSPITRPGWPRSTWSKSDSMPHRPWPSMPT